ncbi:MAG: DNA photolyase family protein, partial [Steroidobacteraceae bacterium]|nr:DNA photolyase family protein [Steroidobacteraceae bacterium]
RGPVIPVFIWAPDEEAPWAPGAAARCWLHRSLESLAVDLRRHGSQLVLRRGSSIGQLRELIAESGARRVVWQRRYEPAVRARDAAVRKALESDRVETETYGGGLLIEPWEITTHAGEPFQVYTPFSRAALARLDHLELTPLPEPPALPRPRQWPKSVALDDLCLLPRIRWDRGIHAAWEPGEAAAQRRLQQFVLTALERYADRRDLPGQDGTSRLSPYLHHGELSPRQIWHCVVVQLSRHRGADAWRRDKFLAELLWREFAYHVLFHFPATPQEPLRPAFRGFWWRQDSDAQADLQCWQRGATGFPLVDAGMRELWETGFMHNRVRMVVGSLLVKNLRIDWREGARWFWDTLVDADLANNTLNWQWVAGCGADAAPYFRIFNPLTQAQRYDPDGAYVRRWIPEIGSADYPQPIVDLNESRAAALAAYQRIRARDGSA